MTISLNIADHFGSFCAGGEEAAAFRILNIEPHLDEAEAIYLNFDGVRNMNSSFCNTLIANIVARDGEAGVRKLRFQNCNPTVQVHIRAAIAIGLSRFQALQSESHSV